MEVGDEIVPEQQRCIARGPDVRELEALGLDPASVAGLAVTTDGWGATTVDEVARRHTFRSLVVLHRGRLAYEWYSDRGGPDRRHACYSITKSFTGTLAATAVHDGMLDRSACVGDLLPELAATGFADATVADIADMTASIGYDEDYDDAAAPAGDDGPRSFGDYLVAVGLAPPDAPIAADAPTSIRALLATIGPGATTHGHTFTYATPLTDVLGWLLERARDRPYRELLGEGIWSHVGAEHDALLAFDPAGTPMAGAGLSITTRDLARFGLLVSEQGRDGVASVIPPPVIEAIRDGGDPDAFQRGGHYAYLTGYSYRDQWWMPGGVGRPISAWGIYGQVLWVDPDAQVVVAMHCGSPDASDERRDLEQDALCRALVAASSSSSWA